MKRSTNIYYRYSELSYSVDHNEYFLKEVNNVSSDVKKLRLSGDPFPLSGALLEQAVKLIKPAVTDLDIHACGLHKAKNLDKILESIPNTVQSINLDFNHLAEMSTEDLEHFSKLPSGIKHIQAAYNGFENNNEKMNAFMYALQDNVETVTFIDGEVIDRAEWVSSKGCKM
jgi:hypothetical protein